jgi:aspartate aminotransferase
MFLERYLWNSRRILKALGALLTDMLTSEGVKLAIPNGAFYLFPDFIEYKSWLHARNIMSSIELCDRLLHEANVAILPGAHFGRPKNEFTARLSYVDFDGARALAAAEHIPPHENLSKDFLKQYCGHTIEAVDRICEWLKSD